MKVRKELLKVGSYTKDSDGISFDITQDFVGHLSSTFDKMKADGVKVPVVLDHQETAESSRGWVEGVDVEGESLFVDMEVNGVDHIDNLDVSAFIPADYMAGSGKVYQRPLRHVALTPVPVIPGLGRWEVISASLSSVQPKGENLMAMDLKSLATSFGISDEMTEENAGELLVGAFEKVKKQLDDVTLQLSEAKKPVKKPAEKLKELGDQYPGLIKIGKEGRKAKIDALLLSEQPCINKVVRDGLVEKFCSDDSIALSLDETRSDFDDLIDLLSKNQTVQTGELSGQQTLQLSDPLKAPEQKKSPLQISREKRIARNKKN